MKQRKGLHESVMKYSLYTIVAFSSMIVLCVAYYDRPWCPSWTVCNLYGPPPKKGDCICSCGSYLKGIMYCNINESNNHSLVGVEHGYCMTFNKTNTTLLVGSCPFNLRRGGLVFTYQDIPSNPYEIDGVLCGYTNRTGQLCGQCVDGYSPPVYSYYPQCVRCSPGTNNWPKYLAVALLPTTAFLLVIIFLRFKATNPIVCGYTLFSQILTSSPIMRRMAETIFRQHYENTLTGYVADIYFAIFGIWNLDFFRLLYTPFCLHPNATTLQVLSLDYIIAVYPLVLIILTYILVRLHYYNCRLVVWMWKPFISCFARCRRQWDIQNSLVDAFATFILLSYVKFLSVSFDILTPAFVWDVHGNLQHWVLYYDGSVEYLGREHIPYVLLAVSVLMIFTILPILVLCIYPYQCSQRFMNRYNINSPALNKFMDTFQGYYKDGTNGTRDYRCFAAMFLILRILVNISLVITIIAFSNALVIIVILLQMFLLSIFQPYKDKRYLKLGIFFLAILIAALSTAPNLYVAVTKIELSVDRVVWLSLSILPLLYSMYLLLHYIHRKSKKFQVFTRKFKSFWSKIRSNGEDEQDNFLIVV